MGKEAEEKELAKKTAKLSISETSSSSTTNATASTSTTSTTTTKRKKIRKKKSRKNSITAIWDQRAAKAMEVMKTCAFSKNFDPNLAKRKKGEKGYGRPPPGSKSEARAKRTNAWVMEQLDILLGVISSLGKPNKKAGGNMFMDFGTLFIVYQDISDTVVGMIQRGRKKKLL